MTIEPNLFENIRMELRRGSLVFAVLAQLRAEQYGYTLRKALAETSRLLGQISLELYQFGLVVLRVWGI